MSQNTITESNNCLNTTSSYNTTTSNVWNNYSVTNDLSPLLTWLSPLDPGLRHSDIQERRVNDVGGWLMDTEEFRRWCGLGGEGEGDEAVLFCYGNPGVGKTFISSLVVDKLGDQHKGQNAAVICFYFDFAARKEQTATTMLGSLLKQVISGMERVPEDIWQALQEQKKAFSGRKPQLGDIVKMLQLITCSQPTFMVIDALDECTAVQRFRLFDSLKEVLKKSPNARIFVTGRPHIRAEIERCLAGRVISVSVGPPKDDIIRFLRVRLREDETPDAMDEALEADILEKIPGSIPEMFILVSLNIEAILQEATIYRRREMLSKMTPGLGLGDTYGATIERIKVQGGDKSRLGMGALMWISHAERPFMADELYHTLAIELGSTDFNSGNIPSIRTLVSCCQGLITVDKEASTVRLIHFTLKEYLSAHPDIFSRPHSAMAEICLTYLNSQPVKALPVPNLVGSSALRDQNPFLEYCSLYWGVHAKQDLSDCVRLLTLQLLGEYDSHISAYFLAEHVGALHLHNMWDASYRLSGVHGASFFGIVEVVAALIEIQGYDTNEGWYLGNSPLAWAARNGHEEVVKMLVGWEGVGSDEPNDFGQTPLSYAAAYGRETVVEILLGQADVNPDRIDNLGRTPLSHAIGHGHEGVVKILLGRVGVSPDRIDNIGRTLLSHAAGNGQEMMVKMLLGWERVDPDKPDNNGRTPLSHAAGYWRGSVAAEGVVKLLLGRKEVSSDKPDDEGRTPLSHAAKAGFEGAVKMLLGQEEVDPDKPDNEGRTPLSYASGRYHRNSTPEGVVKLLLGRKEVNSEKLDNKGRTPLSHLAEVGSEAAVKILLGREEVDPDKPDNDGRTPFSHAAGSTYSSFIPDRVGGVVKMLVGREVANIDKPDNEGRTPLSHAAKAGYEAAVKILLGQEEVDPDKPDNDGRTPLSHAAGSMCSSFIPDRVGGVVKMLVGREEVDIDKPDNEGRTPLSYAAEAGFEGAVKVLLGRGEVNPDKLDNEGRTPLSHAAGSLESSFIPDGVGGAVKMLLGREEVNVDKPDNEGRTPLSHAAKAGFEGAVKMLLGREEVDPDRPDNNGGTPLSHAAGSRNSRDPLCSVQGVVKMLLGREEVNSDKPDNEGRTPLSHAAEAGFEGAVKMLLVREEVNPHRRDNLGRTPLMFATSGAHEGVLALFQSREAVALAQPNVEQSPPHRRHRRFFSFAFRRSRKQS